MNNFLTKSLTKFVTILTLFSLLFYTCGIVYSQPYYDPDTNSVPKDGVTDSTTSWESYIDAIDDGCIIILPHGAEYYLNTSGGLTFDKNVHIIGNGAKFTTGSSVGNAPLLTFSSDGCILEGFEVDYTSNHTDGNDDDFQDAGDDLSTNLRRSILITGDNTTCRNLTITSSVVGIGFFTADNGNVETCTITNSTITSGTANANNYHCGVHIKNSDDVKVVGSTIIGHGQNVLVSESFGATIANCTLSNASNNGIYGSSGPDLLAHDNTILSFDSVGIKARGYGSNVHHNRILCDVSGGCTSGVTITGNGSNGADGFNGYSMKVNHNIITGDALAGINVDVQDSGYLRNPMITFNSIEFDPNAVQACYGIKITSTSTDGAMIIGNTASGHSFGLIMSPASSRHHDNTLIANNNFVGGSNDAFSLNGLRNPTIIGNLGKNCASSRSGIMLYNSIEGNVLGNDFGDSQSSPTQKYGIEEGGSSVDNQYIYNITSGVITNEYRNIDPNALIVVD